MDEGKWLWQHEETGNTQETPVGTELKEAPGWFLVAHKSDGPIPVELAPETEACTECGEVAPENMEWQPFDKIWLCPECGHGQ